MRTIGTGVAFCFFIGFAIQVYKTDCMFSAWGDTREISTSLCNLITSRRAMIAATVGLGACGLLYCTYRYMSSNNSSTKDVLFTPTPFDREARNASDRIMLYDPAKHKKSVENIVRQETNLLRHIHVDDVKQNADAIMRYCNASPARNAPPQNTYVVMNDTGDPVGFINYHAEKENEWSSYKGKIFLLGIRDSEYGKGYASVLMKYAIDDLLSRNYSAIFLDVQEHNLAREWYSRIGFDIDERAKINNKYVRGYLNLTRYQNYQKGLTVALPLNM